MGSGWRRVKSQGAVLLLKGVSVGALEFLNNQARHATQEVRAAGLYRSLAGFALLVCGFVTFPANKTFVALAVVVFNGSVNLVILAMGEIRAHDNALLDLAERKTRQAVYLASLPGATSDELEPFLFWDHVDNRVQQEVGDDPFVPSFWRNAGRVAWLMMVRGVRDLVTVGLAWIAAGVIRT